MESRELDIDEVEVLDGMATALLRTGCKESRKGEVFREGLRRCMEVHGEEEGVNERKDEGFRGRGKTNRREGGMI